MERWAAMLKAALWKSGVVLLGVLLASCASPSAASREDFEEHAEEATSWAEAWEDARCVTVLCGERECAFVRCQDVLGEVPGQVVPARGGGPPVVALPAPGRGPRRWWSGGLWLPEDRAPVFVIPWYGAHPQRHLLRDTDALLRSGKWVQHHIFPQQKALARWFKAQGIDIHQFTLVLPAQVHTRIHSGGPRGGRWNEAWRQFVDAHEGQRVPPAQIWAHAHLLIRRFGLNPGPFEPYR
jgi:uncharacterized lipoprotein (TIGR02269 family)